MIRLTRTDPARNMARFYCLSIEPDLFGGVALVKEWGRLQQGGTIRREIFESEDAALAAVERIATRKVRRGYPRGHMRRERRPWLLRLRGDLPPSPTGMPISSNGSSA